MTQHVCLDEALDAAVARPGFYRVHVPAGVPVAGCLRRRRPAIEAANTAVWLVTWRRSFFAHEKLVTTP